MSLSDILLMALSLAMDCFTVSIVIGALLRKWEWTVIARVAFLFGLFQALMPLLGWLAVSFFAANVENYGKWIAFVLLMIIGNRMIWKSLFGDEEAPSITPRLLTTQLLLAVATSIDAMAIGVSMAVTGYTTLHSMVKPIIIIGLVSSAMSLLGHWLGIRFGNSVCKQIRPELLGGLILVAIGFKVLLF